MPRATPPDRVPKLLDAAAAAFVEHGFQRTQMNDVAQRLGVAKGTIYRNVESKEMLFAAVLIWGDGADQIPPGGLEAPARLDRLAASITADLATAIASLELCAVVAERRRLRSHAAVGDEIERLVLGRYGVMHTRVEGGFLELVGLRVGFQEFGVLDASLDRPASGDLEQRAGDIQPQRVATCGCSLRCFDGGGPATTADVENAVT
jgi:AcrR family transcriptional regulator